jgi:predicted Fe-Mo cluster-binding NifX family protein
MKVCIPTNSDKGLNDYVGEHFGRVSTYTIVDLEKNDVKVIPNTSNHMGGTKNPPEVLAEYGVNVMICQGLGRRAIIMFNDFGIDVYIGASGTVKDAIDAYKKGELTKASEEDACGQHAFRGEHEHDHEQGHHCH